MNTNIGSLEQLLFPILGDLYSWGKSMIQKLAKPDVYEVLYYESTLEILDPKGREGKFSKIEKVKFLQNNVIAIQDQIWGVEKNIVEYKCSPGIPVDFYQSGHKTFVIISLREVKSKNDMEEFHIQWNLKGKVIGYYGFWETYIDRFTKQMSQKVIFPENRPPIRLWMMEGMQKKTIEMDKNKMVQLPDKRWQVVWDKKTPRLFETYTLKWKW